MPPPRPLCARGPAGAGPCLDEVAQTAIATDNVAPRSAIFMIGKTGPEYTILTGNYILSENVEKLKTNLDKINSIDKEQLKEYYKEILNNDEFSEKGGGGLGMIDIARKSGQKLNYNFLPVDNIYSFFSLNIKIS